MFDDFVDEMKQYIVQQAEKALPNEMCGFILRFPNFYEFRQCDNIAPNPTETFEMDWDFMTYYDGMVAAIVHSHPNGEPFLSGADRQAQVATDVPWILAVSGSLKLFQPVAHLRGREFVYGQADCCRLIQDAYHLCGLDVSDHVRTDLDGDANNQALLNYFNNNQYFIRVDNIQAGDIILTSSSHGTPDHAALYLGDDEILHHVHNQLSRREPYGVFWQRKTHSVWRHKKWQPEMMAAIFADLYHAESLTC